MNTMIQKLTITMLLVWAAFSLHAQAPTVTSFSPTSGATGALITINGTNFTNVTAVSFGGTNAQSFNVVSTTQIQAIVGGGSSGFVAVFTTGGAVSAAGFTFCLSPTISIAPAPNDTICAGTSVTFTATTTLAGASPFFQWKKNNLNVGTNSPTYTDANLANNDVITCNLTSTNTCVNPVTVASNSISMTVFPRPTLSSTLTPPAVCSGTPFTYTPTSATPGATFTWSRSAVTGISNPSNISNGSPNETLIDTTGSPVNVTYVFTLQANGCSSTNPANVVVTVNPLPKLTSTLTPLAICSNTVFSYTPTSNIAVAPPPSANGSTAGVQGSSSVTDELAVAMVAFNWSRAVVPGISNPAATGTDNPNETLINTTAAPINVTYVYTLSANSCPNPTNFNVVVTVNPLPTLSSSLAPPAICSNSAFSYVPTSAAVNATFAWRRAAVIGVSNTAANGSGNPNETLINTATAPINVTYVYRLSANSCPNPDTFMVVVPVNPSPTLSSSNTPPAICSNTAFSYAPTSATANTSFAWTRAVVTGISNAAGSGTGNPNETLINTTAAAINVVYQYTLSANGCANPSVAIVTVSVKPLPTLSSSTTPSAICSNTIFSYTPTSATSSTSFSWSRSNLTGISNVPASGTGNPNETLINTSSAVINVTYTYSLLANGCLNPTNFSVVVPVNPRPTLSSTATPPASCSGTAFSYAPTSATTGTSYSWTRAFVTGISNAPSSGTGNPNETLTNTTSAPVNVVYVYTLSVNGCQNPNTFSVTVTVNPQPTLTSTLAPPAICSNTLFSYTPTSSVNNVTFAWSRAAVTGISTPAANATGSPDESLRNTTTAPVNVIYVYSLTANGCTNPTTFSVIVTVNPRPTMTSTRTPEAICSETVFSYTPTGPTTGTQFAWRRPAVDGISNVVNNGVGNPSETLINTTAFPVDVVYEYSLSANGCLSPVIERVTVTVKPKPRLNSRLATEPFCSGTLFRYQSSTATENATVTWSRSLRDGISNPAANGVDSIRETLINTSALIINVKYAYTLTANGCSSNADTIVATVLPIPRLSSSLAPPAICSGDIFDYLPTSGTPNTTFSWSRPAVSGISNPPNDGEDSPEEFLKNISSNPVNVVYIYTLSSNGCKNPRPANVTVTVNPPLTLTSTLTPPVLCTGSVFSYVPTSATPGATFSWTRSAVPGIQNIASRGTGNIGEVLVNNTDKPITVVYEYEIRANDCVSDIIEILVKVVPLPTLTSTKTPPAVCSGTPFSYIPTSDREGATFTWTRAAITGISNPAATGTGNPNETLVDTTALPVNVIYTYTVTANGCSNPQTFNVTVPVNALPVMKGSLVIPAICSGTAAQFTPPNPITTAVYAWSRATIVGISNGAGTGTGAINETLNNTTAAPITVNYVYTLSLNGCVNPTTYNVTVLVNPLPTLSSSLSAGTFCTGTAFNYTPTSATTGAAFSWSRAAVTGITNTAATGIGNVNENLVNTTAGPVAVTYAYLVSANGCANPTPFNVVVNVNFKPAMVITNPAPRCLPLVDIKAAAITAGSTTGLTFTYWQDSAATRLLAVPQAIGAGKYYIKGTAASGCFDVKPVVVKVNPTPDAYAQNQTVCNGAGTQLTVLNPNQTDGAKFDWTAEYRGRISGGSGGAKGVSFGLGAINETLTNNRRFTGYAIYTITPVGPAPTGCTSPPIKVTVAIAGKKVSCPEATPNATTETIAHNSSPKTRVDVINPNGGNYLVYAVLNPGGVKGVTPFPYTRSDTATIDAGILKNTSKVPAILTYIIVPYANGRNKDDNSGGKDDVLGKAFTVTVTVTPAPGIIDPNDGIEVQNIKDLLPKKTTTTVKSGNITSVPSLEPDDVENEASLPYSSFNDLLPRNPEAMVKPETVLLQNVPNPFQNVTKIGFYLHEPTEAVMTIRDAKGSIIYRLKANYDKGWNQLDLNAGELNASGVLYYTLETPHFAETKKMVVLNR